MPPEPFATWTVGSKALFFEQQMTLGARGRGQHYTGSGSYNTQHFPLPNRNTMGASKRSSGTCIQALGCMLMPNVCRRMALIINSFEIGSFPFCDMAAIRLLLRFAVGSYNIMKHLLPAGFSYHPFLIHWSSFINILPALSSFSCFKAISLLTHCRTVTFLLPSCF